MKDLVPELFNILEDMVGDDPAARITMAKASSRLKAWSESLSDEFLATKVWEYCPDKQEHYSQSERERKLKMLDSPKESVS